MEEPTGKTNCLVFLAMISVYLVVVFVVNRHQGRSALVKIPINAGTQTDSLAFADPITIASWNLGYAGLGDRANFVADGGQDFLPISREHVVENTRGITQILTELDADFYLLQELAAASLINRQVDVLGNVRSALRRLAFAYSPNIQTRLIPYPLNLTIGNGTASRFEIGTATGALLPPEGAYGGFISKNSRMLICRVPIADHPGQVTLVNIHLAAFDDNAQVRLAQLDDVREVIANEYRSGNYVIVGGDWNLRLVDTNFPHTTADEYKFWLADLPADFLPEGWTLAADTEVPSVRLLNTAYQPGETYTCVIDGFVLSPNVRLIDVQNVDLQFADSDHQPVRLRVALERE